MVSKRSPILKEANDMKKQLNQLTKKQANKQTNRKVYKPGNTSFTHKKNETIMYHFFHSFL